MPGKNKILYVSSLSGFCGGVERYIYDTASLLAENDFEVYGLFEKSGRDSTEFNRIFRKVFSPGDLSGLNPGDMDVAFVHKTDNLELLRAVRRKYRTIVFVHDHDYYCLRRHKYFPVCRINCHLPANKFYCSVCGGLISRQQGRIKIGNTGARFALMEEIKRCDMYIVMSEFMRKNLEMNEFDGQRIRKLYPSRPVAASIPVVPGDIPRILYVGQLVRGKGVDLLLRALSLLDIPFHADIVGANNDEQMLRKISSELGLSKQVNFTGWQSSPGSFIARANIFAFPSRWQEPFGLTGIEAFSYSVPVVGFNVGGVSEWLHDGENGLLVKERDVAGFAAALKLMANNPERAKSFGANGYQMVAKDYSPAQFIDGFRTIMQQVCS